MINPTPLNPDAVSSIADVILRHCGGYVDTTRADAERAAKAVLRSLAAAQPEVNSVEELDALPDGAYVQGWDGFKHAKTHSGDWVLCVEHTRGSHNSESIELPARVLYRSEVKP